MPIIGIVKYEIIFVKTEVNKNFVLSLDVRRIKYSNICSFIFLLLNSWQLNTIYRGYENREILFSFSFLLYRNLE